MSCDRCGTDDVWNMKVGDLVPVIGGTLRNRRLPGQTVGTPVNLTGCVVRFRMIDRTGLVVVNNALCSVTGDPADGHVEYEWQVGDTDTAGTFRGWFPVVFPSTKPETFPTIGSVLVRIGSFTA